MQPWRHNSQLIEPARWPDLPVRRSTTSPVTVKKPEPGKAAPAYRSLDSLTEEELAYLRSCSGPRAAAECIGVTDSTMHRWFDVLGIPRKRTRGRTPKR